MPTIDTIGTKIKGAVPHNAATPRLVKREIDLKEKGVTSGDVVQCLPVKAGMLVLKTLVRIVRSADDSVSFVGKLGDGANDDGFDTSIDLEAAANTVYQTELALTEGAPNTLTDAYAAGKYYSADDTIDLTVTSGGVLTDAGKIEVMALVMEVHEID